MRGIRALQVQIGMISTPQCAQMRRESGFTVDGSADVELPRDCVLDGVYAGCHDLTQRKEVVGNAVRVN